MFIACVMWVSEVDYVTPMCSPMSYEALLDETFQIECGKLCQ